MTAAKHATASPRSELAALLEIISRKRAEYQAVVAQHVKLRSFVKAEADAQATLDEIKRRDAEELAVLLVSSSNPQTTVDHSEQGQAERELARARREADAARACEPPLIERMAEVSRELSVLEQQVPQLAANVMLGAAPALVSEIDADAKKLRAKYARLWGLRRYVGDTEAIRRQLDAVPLPIHPDNISPDGAELFHAAEAWGAYAVKLSTDPGAEFKE